MVLKSQVLYYKLQSCTISSFQENFVTKIFVIIVKFTKITKIFDHGNLELYGMYDQVGIVLSISIYNVVSEPM